MPVGERLVNGGPDSGSERSAHDVEQIEVGRARGGLEKFAGLGAGEARNLVVAVDDEVGRRVLLHHTADRLFDPILGCVPADRQSRNL